MCINAESSDKSAVVKRAENTQILKSENPSVDVMSAMQSSFLPFSVSFIQLNIFFIALIVEFINMQRCASTHSAGIR